MTNYFIRNRLPIKKTGMIVIPVNDKQYAQLLELYKRGKKNGISMQLIGVKKARKIEPQIRCDKKYKVLYCPDVKTTKPKMYMKQLFGDLLRISNLRLYLGVQFSKRCENVSSRSISHRKNQNVQIEAIVNDNKVYYEAQHIINVSGSYSCKIARSFGFSRNYCMFPIRE